MSEDQNKEVLVKIKSDGKVLKTTSGNLELAELDEVLVENEQFQEAGVIVSKSCPKEMASDEDSSKITIIRKLTSKDKEKLAEKKEEATSLIADCKEKIEKHNLAMDLLDADISYDGKKLTFYFTAPGRIDFRSLVPDLAATFKKLIRLQQIGSRDKAKCMDSIGRCGRDTCCRAFLKGDLENVSIDMAYDQGLGQTGSNRVMGVCGKLQCCLKYELSDYQKSKKKMPAIGSFINTKEGKGKVIAQNVIKNIITVVLEDKRILEVDC